MGKEKIKPLLDAYIKNKGIPTVSESTVGNIIKRYHLFFKKSGRIYHDPGSSAARKGKKKRSQVRHSSKPDVFGYILSDTIERVTEGIKDYFYTAIDVKSRFALALNYKRLSSRNMNDFYRRFESVYPGEITIWQSDNGGEHPREFDEHLTKDGIPHLFSHPRCPKINAFIERYNRILQQEFIDNHLDIIHDKELFCRELAEDLIFYNTKRVHKSLGKRHPSTISLNRGNCRKCA